MASLYHDITSLFRDLKPQNSEDAELIEGIERAILTRLQERISQIDALGGTFSDAHGCGYDEALADVLKILDGSDEPHKCKFPPGETLSRGEDRPARVALEKLARNIYDCDGKLVEAHDKAWRAVSARAIVEAIDALTAAVKAR